MTATILETTLSMARTCRRIAGEYAALGRDPAEKRAGFYASEAKRIRSDVRWYIARARREAAWQASREVERIAA